MQADGSCTFNFEISRVISLGSRMLPIIRQFNRRYSGISTQVTIAGKIVAGCRGTIDERKGFWLWNVWEILVPFLVPSMADVDINFFFKQFF